MAKADWPAAKVRKTFIDFFAERGHDVVPSSSVVPPGHDDSLMFINSGMVQFKGIFTGTESAGEMKRAVDTQKCIRAGGKHNDLDDVGTDSYHHTFFEMLGNWSFGNYFKEEMIPWAWELLTKKYGLDPTRLYITYFEGDEAAGVPMDVEAKNLWLTVGVPEDHILTGNIKDNFWEMGDTGPCGPCSEIHYDRIGGRNAAHLVNQDDPNVLEIWNIVFMTYDRQPDRSLKELPKKNIDTGMGFERLVSVLQDLPSNYATDAWTPLFNKIHEVAAVLGPGVRPYTDKYGDDDKDGIDTAYRVVADHIRMLSFAISDGGYPSNVGAGYVVRRVLRRGCRYARKYLKVEIGNFFSSLLPALVEQMGETFPELTKSVDELTYYFNDEERSFASALVRGEKQFEKFVDELPKRSEQWLSGDKVWRLYDTYGFPVDLTEIMCKERGIKINNKEVSEAQLKAIEASKSEKTKNNTFQPFTQHESNALAAMGLSTTDDSAKHLRGSTTGKIQRLFYKEELIESTATIPEGVPFGIILDKTNMYAEAGGQVADVGTLTSQDEETKFRVADVQSMQGFVIHNGFLEGALLKTGDEVTIQYDELRREPIQNNHTGTHVLNHSLREVLGAGVAQRGSLVDDEKLRFDFTHKAAPTDAELNRIEELSDKYISSNKKVYAKDVPLQQAMEIEGLRAVFGERYPDPVRVVSVGKSVDELLKDPKNKEWRNYSVEFCGGTHVAQTSTIRSIAIVEEGSVSKGIRRVVAYTGEAASNVQKERIRFQSQLDKLADVTRGAPKEQKIKDLQNELNGLVLQKTAKEDFRAKLAAIQKENMAAQKELQKQEATTALTTVKKFFEGNPKTKTFIGVIPISANVKALGEVVNHYSKKEKDKTVFVLAGEEGKGVVFNIHVGTDHVAAGVKAEEWAAVASNLVGGKSGGKEPTRTGQGPNFSELVKATTACEDWLLSKETQMLSL